MTGLQVWLHPSSRTLKTVIGRSSLANDQRPTTGFLPSTAFWRTAAVVRDRRGVFYVANFDARSGQRADSRFSTRTGAADSHLDAAHTMIARHDCGVRRGLLGGKWRSLARPPESEGTGTLPGEHVPGLIGDGHDRVIERSLDVRNAVGDVLALLLLERLLLTFFLCRRGRACCYWFCHSVSVLGHWASVVGRSASPANDQRLTTNDSFTSWSLSSSLPLPYLCADRFA